MIERLSDPKKNSCIEHVSDALIPRVLLGSWPQHFALIHPWPQILRSEREAKTGQLKWTSIARGALQSHMTTLRLKHLLGILQSAWKYRTRNIPLRHAVPPNSPRAMWQSRMNSSAPLPPEWMKSRSSPGQGLRSKDTRYLLLSHAPELPGLIVRKCLRALNIQQSLSGR